MLDILLIALPAAAATAAALAVRNWYNPRIQLFSIEGNIGAGKSTYLERLRKIFPSCTYVKEPLTKWQTLGSPSILELFYQDPDRWSFTFETLTLVTRLANLDIPINPIRRVLGLRCPVISERSIFTSLYVFAQVQMDRKSLTETETLVYKHIADTLTKAFLNIDIKFVYLRTRAKNCDRRIRARLREGEDDIPMEYIETLEHKHDQWLMPLPRSKVLTLCGDTDQTDPSFEQVFARGLDKIKKFVG